MAKSASTLAGDISLTGLNTGMDDDSLLYVYAVTNANGDIINGCRVTYNLSLYTGYRLAPSLKALAPWALLLVLLFAAGVAMFRARQAESDMAVDNMLSSPSVPVSTAIRPALDNDRDARIRTPARSEK